MLKSPFVTRVTRNMIAVAVLSPAIALGQMSLTQLSVAKTENFDSMAHTATASLPSGWKADSVSAAKTTNYATAAAATTQAAGSSGAGAITGTSGGGTYNWATGVTASANDRAIGWLTSGSYGGPRQLMVQLANNTGSAIDSIQVSYNIEKYRSGSRAFNVTFFSGPDGSNWTAQSAGDQNFPADSGNTTILDPPTATTKQVTISGLALANGASYYLRWQYQGVGGDSNGQGLGIDNVSVTPSGTAGIADWMLFE